MIVNPDGSVTWTGQVTFTGATDPLSTGIATMTLTPSGGVSNLPALINGQPGVAPTLRNINVTTLDPAIVPTPTQSGSFTLVTPGGPGTPSVYDLNLQILKGAVGQQGAVGHILGSVDFSNSPAVGQVPVYSATAGTGGTPAVVWTSLMPVTPLFTVPGTAFTALSESSAGAWDMVVSLSVPAQTFRYRPRVSGDLEVTGAVGMRIDAEVRMGVSTIAAITTATTGTLIGYGRGMESALPVHLDIDSYFGAAMNPSDVSPAGVVAPGTAMTIVMRAVRQYGNAPWTTSQALSELRVWLDPI